MAVIAFSPQRGRLTLKRKPSDALMGGPIAQPFASAEQAWFWTIAALNARHDGTGSRTSGTPRPCDPDDVVRCLDRLYRHRRIDLLHARILRIWGERQTAPNPAYAREKCDWRIWREALERLEWPLRVKGIVADATPICSPK